jgi:hypothetical protein
MNKWLHLIQLCNRIQKDLYFGVGTRKRDAERLAKALSRLGKHPEAILWIQAKSLLADLRGDVERAIKYRRKEIASMRHLQVLVNEMDNAEAAEFAIQDRGPDVVAISEEILRRLEKRSE